MFRKKHFLFYIAFLFLVPSCDSDDGRLLKDTTLETALINREFIRDNVIACAASNQPAGIVSVFLYPRRGVSNINFYQTESIDVNKNDFSAYSKGESELTNVFNGYLLKYEIIPEQEKWVIVTFEEQGIIHLSNPIRLKQSTKPTEYLSENITIDSSSSMPIFTWQDGMFNDSKIYFHVVSDDNGNLLSGTYTFEKLFQYYNLDNVVLNITEIEPPNLEIGSNYGFTLLAVSEDNWVNLFSGVSFTVQ